VKAGPAFATLGRRSPEDADLEVRQGAGPTETRIELTWLVDGLAVEGRDYDLPGLLPFWQLTSEQDWALCERNQNGVRSSANEPGPYSPSREQNVIAFDE
jgi:phenylpropionate dioxygenase-like ring-hydroxylating dioxygenase large terminal subunit